MIWKSALQETYQATKHLRDHPEYRWAVVGSVASALHGCPVDPGDLDFSAFSPEGVSQFAAAMMPFAPETCSQPEGDGAWLSSSALPVSVYEEYGFQWHFCRWIVADFKVEIAHIIPPEGHPTSQDGAGIWEGGSEIWLHLQTTSFEGGSLPIVPLEIQLETNMARKLTDRVDEIVRVFRERGYNRALLEQALSRDHLAEFDTLA